MDQHEGASDLNNNDLEQNQNDKLVVDGHSKGKKLLTPVMRLWESYRRNTVPVQALLFAVVFGLLGGGILLVTNYALTPPDPNCVNASNFSGNVGNKKDTGHKPGKGISAHSCRMANGLLKVQLTDGTFILNHGPDIRQRPAKVAKTSKTSTAPAPASTGTASAVGSPADITPLAPVCATDYYGQLLYIVPLNRAVNADIPAYIVRNAQKANAFINGQYANRGYDIRYKMHCNSAGDPTVITVKLKNHSNPNNADVVSELKAQGYNKTNVKYWAWIDGYGGSDACGTTCVIGYGNGYNIDDKLSVNNIHNGGDIGIATVFDRAAYENRSWWNPTPEMFLHEVGHTMGAVQLSAPDSDNNYHCTQNNAKSIMCSGDDSKPEPCAGIRFDCQARNYFNPDPASSNYLATHWNVASQLNHFLSIKAPPVTISGHVYNNTTDKGIANVSVSTCYHTVTVKTNSNGDWSITVPAGASFCAKVTGGVPSGLFGPGVNTSKPGTTSTSTNYSGQVAGDSNEGGFNFRYITAPTIPLYFVKTANTADKKSVEIYRATAGSNYTNKDLAKVTAFTTADAVNGVWQVRENDLYFIKYKNTASGYVEVQKATAASGYQTITTAISSLKTADVATTKPQFWLKIATKNLAYFSIANSTGRVVYQEYSSASGYKTIVAGPVTTLVSSSAGADGLWNMNAGNIMYLRLFNTSSGHAVLRDLTPSSGYQSYGYEQETFFTSPTSTTALQGAYYAHDTNGDGVADATFIRTKNTSDGKVAVHFDQGPDFGNHDYAKSSVFSTTDADNGTWTMGW